MFIHFQLVFASAFHPFVCSVHPSICTFITLFFLFHMKWSKFERKRNFLFFLLNFHSPLLVIIIIIFNANKINIKTISISLLCSGCFNIIIIFSSSSSDFKTPFLLLSALSFILSEKLKCNFQTKKENIGKTEEDCFLGF